jgi:ribosomal protein L4
VLPRFSSRLTSSRGNRDAKLRPAPFLLFKINENQLALEAAIMELTNWVQQHGSAKVAENVRGALAAIDHNEEFIK